MKLFKKVAIIGVGLLGGSIGLAIRKKKLAGEVVGFFRHKEKIIAAKKKGMIDEGTANFAQAIKDADFIILCSPVSDIAEKLKIIKRLNRKTPLITDVGSTKANIVKASRGLNFIGSHPLAGSEASGATFASPGIFEGSLCILTPVKTLSDKNIRLIAEFWKQLGAKTITLKAPEHDHILAYTSHLPHAVAFSLINTIPKKMMAFSAGGLKDTTRIALSSPALWKDIFLTNRQEILKSVRDFEKSLKEFKKSLLHRDSKAMLSLLLKSQKKRKAIAPKP